MTNKSALDLEFTGERLIPEHNTGTAFYYEHLSRYLFAAQFAERKNVLDAGSGAGYGSYILSKIGKASTVTGVDLSADAVRYAKNKYYQNNIKFVEDNVVKLSAVPTDSIDLVVSFELIEHIEEQEEYLKNIKRVLRKDGTYIVSTPNKYTYPEGNEFHVHELYPEEFEDLLKTQFENVKIYFQNYEFSQSIKISGDSEHIIESDFNIHDQKVYSTPTNLDNAEYIIAVCTNNKLPESHNLVSVTANKIDTFDLTKGLNSLSHQFTELYNKIDSLNEKVSDTEIQKLELDGFYTDRGRLYVELKKYLFEDYYIDILPSADEYIAKAARLFEDNEQRKTQIAELTSEIDSLRESKKNLDVLLSRKAIRIFLKYENLPLVKSATTQKLIRILLRVLIKGKRILSKFRRLITN